MSDDDLDSLGQAIRQAREKAGLSIRQLAARVDASHSYIGHLETGAKSHPTATLVRQIAEVTGTPPSELLKFILPSMRMLLRERYGMSDDEAVILANLLEHEIRQRKEGPHGSTEPERHERDD